MSGMLAAIVMEQRSMATLRLNMQSFNQEGSERAGGRTELETWSLSLFGLACVYARVCVCLGMSAG